jgi:hypothetical protein
MPKMKKTTKPENSENRVARFLFSQKSFALAILTGLLLFIFPGGVLAQRVPKPVVPEWAYPGSATHTQVPPPPDFHRTTRTDLTPIGIFKGQSDVGGALVPGASGYDKATGQYTITSAGYNIWYTRDEFRYLWKKMSGDVSLAADVNFPDSAGYGDRKAVLVIRQNLRDDSKEAIVALHGGGLMHLAWRAEKGAMLQEMRVPEKSALRIGIEKRGDTFSIYVSMHGEPMHQLGHDVNLHIDGPFYVGIGFCSHQPIVPDTAILSNVVLKNAAGKL